MRQAFMRSIGLSVALAAAQPSLAGPNPAYVAEMRKDWPGGRDHPLVGRYEGSFLLSQTTNAFDELALPSAGAEGEIYDQKGKITAAFAVHRRDVDGLEASRDLAAKGLARLR